MNSSQKSRINTWFLILLTAPIPLLLAVLFFFKWMKQGTDLSQVTTQFVSRQNTVLAYDAMRVSRRVSDLLEGASRDIKTLALIAPSLSNYKRFYSAQVANVSQYDEHDNAMEHVFVPKYKELAFISPEGEEKLRLVDGQPIENLRSVGTCQLSELCDRNLMLKALKLRPGRLLYGNVMRWYTPKSLGKSSEQEGNRAEGKAQLGVVYKTTKGIYYLGIDYQQFREILYVPTFPYEARTKLLQAYLDGNYTYLLNKDHTIIAHPKNWHVAGINKKTGKWMNYVGPDSDMGTKPVNVVNYSGEQLREYFNRLLQVSFPNKAVDIFTASNLTGKFRVHAVAPILLREGQYKESGIFGHVITGCYVDFFEEPKEKVLPYY